MPQPHTGSPNRITAPWIAGALLLILQAGVLACPFCSRDIRFPAAQRQLRQYANAVIARCVLPPMSGNPFEPAPARFEIQSVVKGTPVAPGSRVSLDVMGNFEAERLVLVLSDDPQLSEPVVRKLTPEGITLFADMAGLPDESEDEAVRLTRLRFFLDRLGDPDRLVSASVLEEFSAAPYALIQKLEPDLDAARLVTLIDDEQTPSSQRGLLFLLYGTAGEPGTAARLADWLQSAEQRRKPGLDGLIGAYLLTLGSEGIEPLLALSPRGEQPDDLSQRRWFAQSLVAAIDFHAQYEDRLTRAEIIAVLHRLLDDPIVAGAAIGELTRLEAWDSLPQVVAAAANHGAQQPQLQRAAEAFFLACPKPEAAQHRPADTPTDSD